MEYLPVFTELFNSDLYYGVLIGFGFAVVIGLIIESRRKRKTCAIANIIVYLACEVMANIITNQSQVFPLIIGSVAFGAVFGYIVSFGIVKVRGAQKIEPDLAEYYRSEM